MNRRSSLCGLIALVLAMLSGCGGGSAPSAESAQAPDAPALVQTVSFRFFTDANGSASEASQTADTARKLVLELLRDAGYRVEEDRPPPTPRRSDEEIAPTEEPPPEAVMRLRIAVTKRDQAIRWIQGGKVLGGYDVRASLAVAFDDAVVDESRVEFRTTIGEMAREELAPLVTRLNGSPRMAQFEQRLMNGGALPAF